MPLGIVGYVAYTYLRGVPTAGNDLVLVAGCAALGATLGALSGRFTSVYAAAMGSHCQGRPDRRRALDARHRGVDWPSSSTPATAVGAAIEHFSVAHSITSAAAWTAALILMASSEAVSRTGILAWRANAVRRQAPTGADFSRTAGHPTPPVPASRGP